jgi:hypothetical protein
MADAYSGIDPSSFQVTADFPVEGTVAGQNLAGKFLSLSDNRWELKLTQPITVPRGKLTVSVKDKQGNISKVERVFSAK